MDWASGFCRTCASVLVRLTERSSGRAANISNQKTWTTKRSNSVNHRSSTGYSQHLLHNPSARRQKEGQSCYVRCHSSHITNAARFFDKSMSSCSVGGSCPWRWETRTGEPHRNLTVPRSAVPSCDTLVSAPFTPWHGGTWAWKSSAAWAIGRACTHIESHETSLLCFGKAQRKLTAEEPTGTDLHFLILTSQIGLIFNQCCHLSAPNLLRVGVCGWVWASETQLTYLATFYLVEHCSYNSPLLQMLRQCWCCQFTALSGLQMCNRELTSMFFYWIQWLFSSLNTNLSHPVLCKVARFLYNCGPSGAHTQRKIFARIGIVTCLKFKRQYGPALAGFCFSSICVVFMHNCYNSLLFSIWFVQQLQFLGFSCHCVTSTSWDFCSRVTAVKKVDNFVPMLFYGIPLDASCLYSARMSVCHDFIKVYDLVSTGMILYQC